MKTSRYITPNQTELQNAFEDAVNGYMEAFCEKHEESLDWWVHNEVGGIAFFCSGRFFNFSDILLDIDRGVAKGLIKEWHEGTANKEINYKSWLIGAR